MKNCGSIESMSTVSDPNQKIRTRTRMFFSHTRRVLRVLAPSFKAVFGCFRGSRWKKASKCKRLIKQLGSSNEDSESKGRINYKAGQLYRDQSKLSAYEQLENFCECICTNLPHISKRRLADDVREAVSSLIFAAARCGELPELHSIRNLFRRHFGCEFERDNVELRPGNLVNPEVKQNLCIKSVPDEVKLMVITEICIGSSSWNSAITKARDVSVAEKLDLMKKVNFLVVRFNDEMPKQR